MISWEKEYARQVIAGFNPKEGTDRLSHCALGLAGESGEVADIIKKSQYRNGTLDREELRLELSDALWYLTAIATMEGYTLSTLALTNVAKLNRRRGLPYDANRLADHITPREEDLEDVPAVPLGAALPCSS